MNDTPDRDIAIFTEALQLSPADRLTYLDRVCGSELDLRHRVEALLRAYEKAGDFLSEPAARVPPEPPGELRVGEGPGDRIGRYKLLQHIGEGGCGVVFMAEQEEPFHRKVALKIIKPGMDTKSVIARFEAERQALALMDHPNIAKVFDAGATESGRPYFVMELVRGIKITEYCDQHSLPTEERLKLFVQVCQAVQHAHQKGIIHRDLKPSNILVTQNVEGTMLPVVIDFGVAKATRNQRLTDKTLFTAFEMLIGTPAYMSPEQAAFTSVDVDTRTDIYSLGVLLYELLTGSTPFDTTALLKSGLDEIRRVIREEEPARPSTRLNKMSKADLTTVAERRRSEPFRLIRSVSGDLDWIVMKAMEKDRSRRYETANGLAMDVKRLLANEAISARPPSNLYRFCKQVQRNKLLFLGITVISVLLLAGLVVVSVALARERESRRLLGAALLQAKTDESKAKTEAAKSQQVKHFLEDMLQGVSPSVARGRDTTMLREILDRTAQRVGTELTNQPAVEAELRSIVGALYRGVGNYVQAEKMDREALAIYRKLLGPESPEAASALQDLGLALLAEGKLTEAEETDREALAIQQRLFGNENAQVATSLHELALIYMERGRFAVAEKMARESLEIRGKLFGDQSLEVADSLRDLAILLGDEGRWIESEQKAREVLAIRRERLGREHPWVASALDDVAWAAGASGKLAEAAALEREALQIRSKILPAEHPDIAQSLYLLGDRMRQRGNPDDAFSVLSAAYSIQRKSLGEDNPASLDTLNSLGLTLEAQGKLPQAESTHREALALWFKRGKTHSPRVVDSAVNLTRVLIAEDKCGDAEEILGQALALSRGPAGDRDPRVLGQCGQLAHALIAQKKYREVEQLLNRVLTPDLANTPPSVDLWSVRAELMGRQGRWQAAAADSAIAITLQPAEQYHYHRQAALLVVTGDRSGCARICQKALATFGDTTNPYTAERLADDCLLFADSGADLTLADNLATRAVTLGKDEGAIGYFQACKALSEYRQKRFAEAVAWAEKSLKSTEALAKAKSFAALAMAQWQLGKQEAARVALAQGNELAPVISSGAGATDLGESWVAWLFARIALDEAAALIKTSAVSDGLSNTR
jgi:serine/threonine protein kinase